MDNRKGFTLIELLIVIAIIGILAAAVLVAVDPVGRIQDARNARRWSEANGLLNAVLNKQVDDRQFYAGVGAYPVIKNDTKSQIIMASEAGVGTCACAASGVTLEASIASIPAGSTNICFVSLSTLAPKYISEVPLDAGGAAAANNTGYYFRMGLNGRVTVGSCNAEPGSAGTVPTIKVTR